MKKEFVSLTAIFGLLLTLAPTPVSAQDADFLYGDAPYSDTGENESFDGSGLDSIYANAPTCTCKLEDSEGFDLYASNADCSAGERVFVEVPNPGGRCEDLNHNFYRRSSFDQEFWVSKLGCHWKQADSKIYLESCHD